MTGGVVVVLGKTGRNFAAGMSGGYAYVLDTDSVFHSNCNTEMVDLETVNEPNEIHFLKSLVSEHVRLTGSQIGKSVLRNFVQMLPKFVKVFPQDLKLIMATERKSSLQITAPSPQIPKFDNRVLDIEDLPAETVEVKEVDKLRGFVKYSRKSDKYRDPIKRAKDWKEVNGRLGVSELKVQAARCMDCGVAFCQSDSGMYLLIQDVRFQMLFQSGMVDLL